MTALWLILGFVAYGTLSGMVWLRFGRFPTWYAAAVLAVAAIIGVPALLLSGSQF